MVALLFAGSRAGAALAGIRFDLSALRVPDADPWQLIDLRLLRTQLISSVWNLHSQPPLFNVMSGWLLKEPVTLQVPLAWALFAGMGLAMVLCTFQALVDLRTPVWVAWVVTLLVIADPAYLLFENWYSYAYPTAALLAVSVLCCVRYFGTRGWGWGVGFFAALAAVVLLDSSYQLYWLAAVVLVALAASRRHWRSLVAVAVVPALLIGGWYVKDAVQWGTYTTSSWLGMNLAYTTLAGVPRTELVHLVRAGTLTPIALVPPFSPVGAYVPRYVRRAVTGVPALDRPFKSDGGTNYDNLAYVEVSSQYLHDDLAFIGAEPASYADLVAKAASLWFVPADEYAFVTHNEAHLSHWTRLYDGLAQWQWSANEGAALTAILHQRGPGPAQVSWAVVLQFLLTLAGAPLVAWRRWRSDRAGAVTVLFLWLTVGYAWVATSLIEFGENERYRLDLGPLPLIASAVVLVAGARWWRVRRARRPAAALTPPVPDGPPVEQGTVTDRVPSGV